jgi:hypothetical protein
MSISLKSLEIYIHQNPNTSALMSMVSTNNLSFEAKVSTASSITITSTSINMTPYQITYWVKDYTSLCPPTSYNFFEIHSNTAETVKISGKTIILSNISRLLQQTAKINANTKCKAQPRTIAKIIILYSEDSINF